VVEDRWRRRLEQDGVARWRGNAGGRGLRKQGLRPVVAAGVSRNAEEGRLVRSEHEEDEASAAIGVRTSHHPEK
jgi:hypothetical protein